MVLLSPAIPPIAFWEFEADLLILHHPTTISTKYQAMGKYIFFISIYRLLTVLLLFVVHCGSIRQTATIMSMSVEHLRTGDRATVRFRFIKSPEYLRVGMKLVFREGRTKAIGSVSKLYPPVVPQTTNTRGRTRQQATAGVPSNLITTDASQPIKRNDSGDDPSRLDNKRSKQIKTTTDVPIEQNTDTDKNTS
jgi:hypothetical protein